MSCTYIITKQNKKLKEVDSPITKIGESTTKQLNDSLKTLDKEDLKNLLKQIHENKFEGDEFVQENLDPNTTKIIGSTSYQDLIDTFNKNTNINLILTKLKTKLNNINGFNELYNNILIKFDQQVESPLYEYAEYDPEWDVVKLNLSTLTKYQQYPIAKAFMDYYIYNGDLTELQSIFKDVTDLKVYLTKEIYSEDNIDNLKKLLNYFELGNINGEQFKKSANIVKIANLRASYLNEESNTVSLYQSNKYFGYLPEETISFESLFTLKRGDLIKLNFGALIQGNKTDEEYNKILNSFQKKIKSQIKKTNPDISDEELEKEVFKKSFNSAYYIFHKYNNATKELHVVSTIKGNKIRIKLDENQSDQVLGNLNEIDDLYKRLGEKSFTIKRISSGDNNINYLEKKSKNEIDQLYNEFSNKLKNKEIREVEINEYFNDTDLLKIGDYFKQNGTTYLIEDIAENIVTVTDIEAINYVKNNHYQIFKSTINTKTIYIDSNLQLNQGTHPIAENNNGIDKNLIVDNDIIYIGNNLFKVLHVLRDNNGNVYQLKLLDPAGHIFTKKLNEDPDLKINKIYTKLQDTEYENNLSEINNNKDKIFNFSVAYPGKEFTIDDLKYHRIFLQGLNLKNNNTFFEFYKNLKLGDVVITNNNEILYVNSKSNNHIRCRNINGDFVIINRLDIQTMLLSKYENRFSHDQSEFNMFEDCISHLNSTRVIGVGELQLYQQFNPKEVRCILKKGIPVTFDIYGNIIGSMFTSKIIDKNSNYQDVTPQYCKQNKISGGKIYRLYVSSTNDQIFQTKQQGFSVHKFDQYKSKLQVGQYLKLYGDVNIFENTKFKGGNKVVRIQSITHNNYILNYTVYDSLGDAMTTVFAIPKTKINEYISHVYTPYSLLSHKFKKINLSKEYFKSQNVDNLKQEYLTKILENFGFKVKTMSSDGIKKLLKDSYFKEKSESDINNFLSKVKAFITYKNGHPEIICNTTLTANSLFHELLHVILGKFKYENKAQYNVFINSILDNISNQDKSSHQEIYKNWDSDFINEELAIDYLVNKFSELDESNFKGKTYMQGFLNIINSIKKSAVSINIESFDLTIKSIFGEGLNNYNTYNFIENELKQSFLIESFIENNLQKTEC